VFDYFIAIHISFGVIKGETKKVKIKEEKRDIIGL
jgi:hypothetical protein